MGGFLSSFKKLNTQDRIISQLQDNTEAALIPIQNSPLVGGQLLQSVLNNQRVNYVSLISGQDNLISHNLGYVPTLYFAGIPNVSATIWSPSTSSLHGSNVSSTQINLRCSANCNVAVWVI